jgi:acyl carrier protein
MALDRQALLNFLEECLGVDTSGLTDEMPLFSSGLLDSVGLAQLIVYVETEGGVSFEPEDVSLDHLDSVEKILAFVAARHGN